MKYQFTFSIKKERIYISDKEYEENIGALSSYLLEKDWTIPPPQNVQLFLYEEIKQPIFLHHLISSNSFEEIKQKMEQLDFAKKILEEVLDVLLYETDCSYENTLKNYYSDDKNQEAHNYLAAIKPAAIASIFEQNKIPTKDKSTFTYLLESEDFYSAILQELQFMLSNKFFVRRCLNCGSRMLTRKRNQVYCKRIVSGSNKTCAKIAPQKMWLETKLQPDELKILHK